MKKYRIFACITALLLLLAGCAGEQPETTAAVETGNAVFGTFTTTDLAGNPVDQRVFSDHKLTMVNIWATFCNPCIGEMPDLAKLNNAFGDDFQVVGIVIDATDRNGIVLPDKKAEADYIVEATGANYLHLLPSKALNSAYLGGVQSVPETIFVDENGNQVGQKYLGARSKAEWTKIINTLLESMK